MLKTILLTMTATVATLSLAASIFLNSLLGFFGLAATSVQTLTHLHTSQQILEQVKKRHALKRHRVSRRLVKRSGRRVASTALAAATVGTVGVAVVMTGLEIEDYCEQMRSLQEDANLMYRTDTVFDHEQCMQEAQQDGEAILGEATDSMQVAASEALTAGGEYGRQAWNNVLAAWHRGVETTGNAAMGLWKSSVDWMQEDPGDTPPGVQQD